MQSTKIVVRASALANQRTAISCSRAFTSSPVALQRISELVKNEHRELETYKNNILNATNADEKVRWQNQFTWQLARHSIAEELVVYPAMTRNCPGGQNVAEKDRGEHQTVKELLYKFQKLSPDSPEFEPTIKALWTSLAQHIKEEETEDLPLLEKHTYKDESEELSAIFKRTKMFIPTRSHPSAPARPPFETVAGLMTAPLDKLGDLFRKFPKEV